MTRKFPVLFAICVLLIAAGFAAGDTFTASVDNNHVTTGDYIQITFTLEGSTGGKNFLPPSFNDFMILSGPNQSSSMQIINGSVSSSVTYSYVLQPKSEGTFTIGAATIELDGKKLQTDPLQIEVTKGSPRPPSEPSRDGDVTRQIGNNLLLKATVDRSNVFTGEQITVSYRLYTRVDIANYNVRKTPALTGFWSEDLIQPGQIQLSTERVEGKQYQVGIFRKIALFPQKSGTLQIDPMEVDCVVQVSLRGNPNDPFDSFFGRRTEVTHKIASRPINIQVSPLPENAPEGFSGAVGKFTMNAWLEPRQVKANDASTFRIKITGQGNLKLLEPPVFQAPPDVDRFDPKSSTSIARQSDTIAGSRTFEYLLVPRRPVDQKIPALSFVYFDVDKKSYVALKTSELVLKVLPGSEVLPTGVTGLSKQDVKLLGQDIRFIKSGNVSLKRSGKSFAGSALFYALYLAPLLLFACLLTALRRHEHSLENVPLFRSRKARKLARKRLARAGELLKANQKEEFYAEVSRALWGYIGDKLTIPASELTVENVQSRLHLRGITGNTISSFTSAIEQCEFARFAPSSDSHQMDDVFQNAVKLVSSIEEELQ